MGIRSVSRYLLVIAMLLVAAREARADGCTEPEAPPATTSTWFYVQLVTPGRGPTEPIREIAPEKVTGTYIATEPFGTQDFHLAIQAGRCFVSAVVKSSFAVKVKVKAVGYNKTECDANQLWRRWTIKQPFRCELQPEPDGIVGDHGYRRLSDLPANKRDAVLDEIVTLAMDLPVEQRVAAMTELAAKIDVRPGLLARRCLAYFTPACTQASCVDKLVDEVGKPIKVWVAGQKLAIAQEEERDRVADQLRVKLDDGQLRVDVLKLIGSPSLKAPIGKAAGDRVQLELFIANEFPTDRANAVRSVVKTSFQM